MVPINRSSDSVCTAGTLPIPYDLKKILKLQYRTLAGTRAADIFLNNPIYLPYASGIKPIRTALFRNCRNGGCWRLFRKDEGGIRDQGSGIRDQGSGIRDQGSGRIV